MVYVISKKGSPLMPTTPRKARLLLDGGKAKCIRREPFTIKLLYETTEHVQDVTLGIDTGSSTIGSAAINDSGDVLYASEVEVRNDITGKMTQRANYRRGRRYRNTRYRKARWSNRKNSKRKDRHSPTVTSKVNSHLKEARFVKKLLPISKVILETSTFDPHALKNPEVLEKKWMYQKGVKYGYANSKAYVLHRDKYTCQHCKGKSKCKKLECHHIIFRRHGGSDEPENLIAMCVECHDKLHAGLFDITGGSKKGILMHATQMNVIRSQLLKSLDCEETFGFVTKEHRQMLGLPKAHYIDAAVIAGGGKELKVRISHVIKKKCVSDGDYQQTKGKRGEKLIPVGKLHGFRKFDKVEYRGIPYFIKGRMSSGYAVLMSISGEKQDLKPIPKFGEMSRLSARKSWIIHQETIQNIA